MVDMGAGRSGRTAAEQARLQLRHPASSEAERDARVIGRRHGGDARAAVGEIAEALGHAGGRVVPTASGARWFGMCSCGWVCPHTDRTEAAATGALLHHVRLALREWHRTGLPLAAARKAQHTGKPPPHYVAWKAAVAKELAAEETGRAISGESPESVRRAV